MSDGAQSEQDEWMAGVGVNVARYGARRGGDKKKGPRSAITAVQFSIPVKVPDASFSYATAGGTVSYVVSYKPAGEETEPDVEIKFKNGHAEIEAKLKQKYGKDVVLSEGVTASGKEGSLGIDLELTDNATQAKTTFAFHLAKVDAEHAEIEFLALEASQTYPLIRRQFKAVGLTIETEGRIDVKIVLQPNKKRIALATLKRLGFTAAEDTALGVTEGGIGAAGEAALAAAASPTIVIAGGIVGGLALCAGAMAWIDALESTGRDAGDVCVTGARRLRAYAESYGSMMRGKPGPDANGNADAEAALKIIMDKAPGTTKEQAIDAAIKSKQNFENLAYRALLPSVRNECKKAYDQKHPWTPDNTLMNVMSQVLDPQGHY